MPLLKNISYPKQIYSTLGSYFSINSNGLLSILYRMCLSLIYPFQLTFNTFDIWRRKKLLIAYCDWKVGQLTNLLNKLYDPIYNRIYITQTFVQQLFEPDIDYPNNDELVFFPDIDSIPLTNSDSLG